MIEKGATHVGVATDHVIESFRNGLWPGYKTGEGIEPALWAQFHPLEDALAAMGVVVWPMVELEADDALASAARIAGADARVEKVCIWTPDKDLAQCVRGDRVVQIDRRSGADPRCRGRAGESSASSPRSFPTTWRWSAMPPTAIRALPGSGRSPPRGCSTRMADRATFRRRFSATSARTRCCSRSWPRWSPTRRVIQSVDELRWRGAPASFAPVAETIDARLVGARGTAAAVSATTFRSIRSRQRRGSTIRTRRRRSIRPGAPARRSAARCAPSAGS